MGEVRDVVEQLQAEPRLPADADASVSAVWAIYPTATMASISTRALFGSAATPTATRAGGSSAKNAP